MTTTIRRRRGGHSLRVPIGSGRPAERTVLACTLLRRQLDAHGRRSIGRRAIATLPPGVASPAPDGTIVAPDASVPIRSGDIHHAAQTRDGRRNEDVVRLGAEPELAPGVVPRTPHGP